MKIPFLILQVLLSFEITLKLSAYLVQLVEKAFVPVKVSLVFKML